MLRRVMLAAAVLLGTAAHLPSSAQGASLPRVVTHENRSAAGTLKGGVLTLNLEITKGDWYPEAESGPHIAVYAFAEAGKAPAIPGPLVRVPVGTKISATVKNALAVPMEMHGLFTRPGREEAVVV